MKIPGYRVHKKIGSGGMAAVYLGTQEAFDRKVAIKIIANTSFDSDEAVERFRREANIIAGLSHQHIVPVYDVGSIGNYQFLAMEYLPGGELTTLIKAGLEPNESLDIIQQIARALHFAHNKGYIHRDVKPDNIMFREDLSAVLTDFGIARPKNDNVAMTERGKVVGTPIYMSPEQSQNKPIDGRADLYSLGVILFQMLTKELPYKEEDAFALAVQHIQDPIPKLPASLSRFQAVINKLMAKEPDQRFQTGLELVKALDQLNQPETDESGSPEAHSPTPDLAIVEDSHKPETSEKNLEIAERLVRKLGVLKRYALDCTIRSEEHQHFAILFSQLTTEIMDWHQLRKKQCGELRLTCYVKPEMVSQVDNLVEQLQEEDSPFSFLKKNKVTLCLLDQQGKKL